MKKEKNNNLYEIPTRKKPIKSPPLYAPRPNDDHAPDDDNPVDPKNDELTS